LALAFADLSRRDLMGWIVCSNDVNGNVRRGTSRPPPWPQQVVLFAFHHGLPSAL